MSILSPSSPTTAQKQSQVAANINGSVGGLYMQMKNTFNGIFRSLWTNPLGLTPQQVCDSLGTNAGDLFRLAGILEIALNTAQPGSITATAPNAYVINSDGTVTIGAPVAEAKK